MYTPTLKEFLNLSKKGNLIPVFKEVNADLDTPVSAFLKIAESEYAFLLESVEGQEKIARYSFLGSNPSLIIEAKNKNIKLSFPDKRKIHKFTTQDTPLQEIKKIMVRFKSVKVAGLPRFYGGLVGYMGYDAVRYFEQIPDDNPDDLKIPDLIFMLTDTMLVFDHVKHKIKIITNVMLGDDYKKASVSAKKDAYLRAINKIERIHSRFPMHVVQGGCAPLKSKHISSNFTKDKFREAVVKAKRYIKAGDIIQVVFSQRFKMNFSQGDPFKVYRNLRSSNPSPYMYFLKFKDIYLVGSSPEMLVRCEDGIVQTRPIAGTRPRGKNDRQDNLLAKELFRDKKERAEHLMLVDLGRNDLGRVCKSGSVKVDEFMRIEKYSHVMHLVSEVRGILDKRHYDIYDVLRSAFPAGTVSGSPKIRAMEIIDELENIKRGPYAGCIGYFSFSHNLDTCITIRTVLINKNNAYIQAGAGIVADSIPQNEYLESVNKAMALIEAVVKSRKE